MFGCLNCGGRHAVGKQSAPTSLDLKASAFDPKEKVWTRFPPEGSKHTPPHQSCDFRWKDYCPMVFRLVKQFYTCHTNPNSKCGLQMNAHFEKHIIYIYEIEIIRSMQTHWETWQIKWSNFSKVYFFYRTLRKLFKVDPADYMLSICGDNALRELSSPGKSGSFFYLTSDDRYMIKTVKKSEVKVN